MDLFGNERKNLKDEIKSLRKQLDRKINVGDWVYEIEQDIQVYVRKVIMSTSENEYKVEVTNFTYLVSQTESSGTYMLYEGGIKTPKEYKEFFINKANKIDI